MYFQNKTVITVIVITVIDFWTQLYDFEDTKICLAQRKTTS